jgi:hypothetical protein
VNAEDLKRSVNRLAGFVTGALALLGAIKTLIETSSGRSFELRQLAFYVGAAAWLMLIGAIPGLLVYEFVKAILGVKSPAGRYGAAIAGLVVTMLFPIAGVLLGVAFDYDGTDNIGRNGFAISGLIALVVGVWLWRHGRTEKAENASAERANPS